MQIKVKSSSYSCNVPSIYLVISYVAVQYTIWALVAFWYQLISLCNHCHAYDTTVLYFLFTLNLHQKIFQSVVHDAMHVHYAGIIVIHLYMVCISQINKTIKNLATRRTVDKWWYAGYYSVLKSTRQMILKNFTEMHKNSA